MQIVVFCILFVGKVLFFNKLHVPTRINIIAEIYA